MSVLHNKIKKIARHLTAASEISVEELPEDRQQLISVLNLNVIVVFQGMHGYIIHFQSDRFNKRQIKKLVNDKNFRWLEGVDNREMAIGC